jgi:bacteriocin-like protein
MKNLNFNELNLISGGAVVSVGDCKGDASSGFAIGAAMGATMGVGFGPGVAALGGLFGGLFGMALGVTNSSGCASVYGGGGFGGPNAGDGAADWGGCESQGF